LHLNLYLPQVEWEKYRAQDHANKVHKGVHPRCTIDAMGDQGPRFELYCYWHRGGQEMRQYRGAAAMFWWKDYQLMKTMVISEVEGAVADAGLRFGYANRPDPGPGASPVVAAADGLGDMEGLFSS
jgi:hypothetical protein